MYLKEMMMTSCKKKPFEGIPMDFSIAQQALTFLELQ